MKYLVTMATAVTLAGCAGIQSQPPRYDYSQQALIAPGFPVEQIEMPPGYQFVDIASGRERQKYTNAWEQGSADESTLGVAWGTTQGNTAVMTTSAEWVSPPSIYLPWEDTDGYEFLRGQKIQYRHFEGRYQDVIDDASYLPEGAPDCAYGLVWMAKNANKRKRLVGTYTEGVTCHDLPLLTGHHYEQLRERAFELFGLK